MRFRSESGCTLVYWTKRAWVLLITGLQVHHGSVCRRLAARRSRESRLRTIKHAREERRREISMELGITEEEGRGKNSFSKLSHLPTSSNLRPVPVVYDWGPIRPPVMATTWLNHCIITWEDKRRESLDTNHEDNQGFESLPAIVETLFFIGCLMLLTTKKISETSAWFSLAGSIIRKVCT